MRILYLPNSKSQQRQFEKTNVNIYPVRLAMEAEFYRKQGHFVDWYPYWKGYESIDTYKRWGKADGYDKVITEPENLPFLTLPRPDRVFTRAKDYTSGNYKYLPGTHIMSASGCWWGRCTFCVENRGQGTEGSSNGVATTLEQNSVNRQHLSPLSYEVRPVEDVIEEIEECRRLGFKEVFDDSATFPMGAWREKFLQRYRNIQGRPVFSCNARICNQDFMALKQANFRMLLFGIESASQYTLDRINKGVKIEDIIPTLKKATEAGIEVHTAWMFGYSWESDKDAINTLRLIHYLLKKGYSKTAQASFYNPQNKEKEGNYSSQSNENHRKYIKKIYDVAIYPEFWFNKLRDIRNLDDLKYLWLQIKKGIQR